MYGQFYYAAEKNPDVSELVRGKTGRVIGRLMALLTTMKGLPLAYNKDMQEDKEGVFDAADTLYFSLEIYAGMLRTVTVNSRHTREVLEHDFSNATDMADYLAKKGLPFRKAHAVVGQAVQYCIAEHKVLHDLTMEELHQWSPLFDADIKNVLDIDQCIQSRSNYNGTSPMQVKRQMKEADDRLAYMESRLNDWRRAGRLDILEK